ncbi:MAG: sigma-54-dependent Fis family transcriptional regulator [Candidatus Tectomicrobia bacterium]|uniref:Sigma-54-dependent Fis family transcriptional regulator n=1 Tax=Tectimicrobiota bacterium TaxID=2528274 RepID=A0A937W4P8_UNCTE|nr:sigma-54-dependent Fis family transcriptional regulator [Candidatus Tectomicrobia bacterium]
MAKEHVLVVDDDAGLLTLMQARLEAAGYQVTIVGSGTEALAWAQDHVYDLALVDLKMADLDGLALLRALRQRHPHLPVLILTAHGTIASAVEATKLGAYDYLTKPFDAQDLLHRVEKALEIRGLKGEVARLQNLVQERYHFENIIASSSVMQQVLRQVAQVAVTDSIVCLYGESGTGKELIAKAIHTASQRANGPFVALNCGAIPEGLLENKLFGHIKGAYTGADQAQRGLLQQADGGTFFLDEIAELPTALQVKLLRVLQEREFYPLGAGRPAQVDIRVVTATNKDLWQAVREGTFREDLYYRIHVIPVFLPPLRERLEDIPLLAQAFIQRFSAQMHKTVQGLTAEAIQRLMLYAWPGNVRELGNVIERAVVLAPGELITPDLLLLGRMSAEPSPCRDFVSLKEAQDALERTYLLQVLTATRGNVSRAAALSGKYRGDFYKLLHKHGLDPEAFRDDTAPVSPPTPVTKL